MGIADTLAEQGYRVLLSDPFYGDTAAGKEDIMDTWLNLDPWKMKVPTETPRTEGRAFVSFFLKETYR